MYSKHYNDIVYLKFAYKNAIEIEPHLNEAYAVYVYFILFNHFSSNRKTLRKICFKITNKHIMSLRSHQYQKCLTIRFYKITVTPSLDMYWAHSKCAFSVDDVCMRTSMRTLLCLYTMNANFLQNLYSLHGATF